MEVESLKLFAIYDADPRPTFVIELSNSEHSKARIVSYSNPALLSHKYLFSALNDALCSSTEFRAWSTSDQSHELYFRYGGVLWFGFTLKDRWKVVSTISNPQLAEEITIPLCALPCGPVPNAVGSSHPSYESTIDKLKREIWLCNEKRTKAEAGQQSCREALARMKQQLKVTELSAPQFALSRTSSGESLSTRSRLYSETVRTDTIYYEPQLRAASTIVDKETVQNSAAGSPPQQASSEKYHPKKVNSDTDSEISLALERFHRLAEAVDAGFFDFDTSGKLLYANNSWYALSGHPREPEHNTTLTFQKYVHPDDTELVAMQWKRLLMGFPSTFEMRWKKSSLMLNDPDVTSDAQWVVAACIPVMDENGQVKSVTGCMSNINAQKQNDYVAKQRTDALKRARTSEQRFVRFVEVAPIAIVRFDKHKNIEYCNDRWFELTGTPNTRFEDITWPYGVADEDIDKCSEAWNRAIHDHSIGQIECKLRKIWHDNEGRHGQAYVHCTFFAEYLEDGTFDGLMWTLLDISHLKWAENMQKARADVALEAKRQQENFIDITSHEMRNPLSAIVQCADTAIASLDDIETLLDRCLHIGSPDDRTTLNKHLESSLDAIQTILSCAAHQQRIVDDILTLSKLDSDLLLITPTQTDIVNMVQTVIKMFEIDSTKADVTLTCEICQSFHDLGQRHLMLDPTRVSQILINLVGNAIKFTKTEKVRRVLVQISASTEPPSSIGDGIRYVPAESVLDAANDALDGEHTSSIYLKLAVQDTGRGLSLEENQRLFIRFSQASPKTHVQYGGHGLGLFISRKLTEMQGGEIGISSEPGIGSSFAFYIKTPRITSSTILPRFLAAEERNEQCIVSTNCAIRKDVSILLVEDNLVNQKVLAKQLEKEGCKVFVVGHGGEALDFIKTTQVWADSKGLSGMIKLDIILMDLEMPVMGGLQCTREIRKFEGEGKITTHLPIISISANARQEQVREARMVGVDDTITKPFRIRDLIPKLNKLIT